MKLWELFDRLVVFDTETTGLNQMTDTMVGISLAADSTHGAYIPLRHRSGNADLFAGDTLAPNQLDIATVYELLWPIFTNPEIVKVGHNMKFDLHILANEGWDTSKIAPILCYCHTPCMARHIYMAWMNLQ